MTKSERDIEICRLYMTGTTMEDIRRTVKLSRQRVQQILRKHELARADRPVEPSDREEYVGINLPEQVKVALREEAARRGLSMSKLSSDTLRDMLRTCGYPVEAERI